MGEILPSSLNLGFQEQRDDNGACCIIRQMLLEPRSVPGLAFLHRLVLAIHLVCVEVGACGIRLGCLLLKLTGLNRFVGRPIGRSTSVTSAATSPDDAFSLRIRAIDDDPLLRQSLHAVLQAGGHVVTVAAGREEGMAAFCAARERQEPFEVILTD